MTDDQTLGQMSALPETRKLIGTQGVKFKRYYVTDPLCCPSRATFLTGQYAHNTGVISNGGPNGLDAFDESSRPSASGSRGRLPHRVRRQVPERLRPRRAPARPARVERLARAARAEHAEAFDYELNENGEVTERGSAPEDYKTTVLGDLAVGSIRSAARADRPLFLVLAFNAPHAPSTPAPGDAGSLDGTKAPRSPAFDEEDLSDKPGFLRDRPPLTENAIARIDDRNQRALESLAEVDRQVERLVEVLRDRGELGNTYVLFTSDNGYIDGEHRIEFGKLLAYEPASQVPLLIRGPGIPAGETSDALVGNVDLAPTIAQIAGGRAGDRDRRRVAAAARALPRALDRRRAADRVAGPRPLHLLRLSVRGDPRRPLHLHPLPNGAEELYNLARDPHELDSLADEPAYAERKRPWRRRSTSLRDCRGEECDVSPQAVGSGAEGR